MTGNLYEDLYTFFITSCSVLLRMKNVSDSNFTENQSTYFTFNIFFIENSDLGLGRGFRNVGKTQSDAGEIPKRTYTLSPTVCNSAPLRLIFALLSHRQILNTGGTVVNKCDGTFSCGRQSTCYHS
jgi:hypothetical protein